MDEHMDLIFFNGGLMRGMRDHRHLADAEFVESVRTAAIYRLFSIRDYHPGMFMAAEGETGYAIWGEIYRVSPATWQYIASVEPPGLYRGRVWLEDGRNIYGMLFPRELCVDRYQEISDWGSWRKYCEFHGFGFAEHGVG